MYKIVSNYRLLCEDEEKSLYYHKGHIIKKMKKNNDDEIKVLLPMSKRKKIMTKFRLLERLCRLEPRFAYPIGREKVLFSYHGYMYRLNTESMDVHVDWKYREGMNNPLSLCCVKTKQGKDRILYGEYWGNVNKEKVRIYEREKDDRWSEIYAFSEGSITHIHQIVYDMYRECFWILTGDKDNESGLWMADENFKQVTPILKGKQMYRSCFLLPLEKGVMYATDSPIENNAIYFVDLSKTNVTVEKLYDMPGPCIYGKKIDDKTVALATSVEPDSTLSTWRYRFTNKLGDGVKSRKSYIIYGNMEDGFQIVMELKKDKKNMWLFQFGNFYFPIDMEKKTIKATGIALKYCDGKTIEVSLGGQNE